jgi:hypothetical protein
MEVRFHSVLLLLVSLIFSPRLLFRNLGAHAQSSFGTWTTASATIPQAQAEAPAGCAAEIDGSTGAGPREMFLFGGADSGFSTNGLTRITLPTAGSLAGTTVSPVATEASPVPSARYGASCVVRRGFLFMLGGYGGTMQTGLWRLNVSGDPSPAWEERLTLNPRILRGAASGTDSVMLVVYDGQLHSWDTVGNTFGTASVAGGSPPPASFQGASLVRIGPAPANPSTGEWNFLLFGGCDTSLGDCFFGTGVESRTLYRLRYKQNPNEVIYSVEDNGTGPNTPIARWVHAAGWDPALGRLYVGYGWSNRSSATAAGSSIYDVTAGAWSTVATSGPAPTAFHSMAWSTLVDPQTGDRVVVLAGGRYTTPGQEVAVNLLVIGDQPVTTGTTGSPGTTGSTGTPGFIDPGSDSASEGASSKQDDPTPAIVGGVVGGVLCLLCAVGALVWFTQHRISGSRVNVNVDSDTETNKAVSPAELVDYHNVNAVPEYAYHNMGSVATGSPDLEVDSSDD